MDLNIVLEAIVPFIDDAVCIAFLLFGVIGIWKTVVKEKVIVNGIRDGYWVEYSSIEEAVCDLVGKEWYDPYGVSEVRKENYKEKSDKWNKVIQEYGEVIPLMNTGNIAVNWNGGRCHACRDRKEGICCKD